MFNGVYFCRQKKIIFLVKTIKMKMKMKKNKNEKDKINESWIIKLWEEIDYF